MCGICGAAGLERTSMLDDMAACLRHRGPDAEGQHADGSVMLASRRLRVIDVDGGDQPIYNESGDVVVVYNGEIYNFHVLRDELTAAGHEFTTESDTEVLVHGYEEYGPGVFGRLNGMFAVALWDATEERLFLARDRAGVKPLYYAERDDGVLFASEPKSILRSGLVEPAVDSAALEYFLQLRYSPSATSLFRGIDAVLPGTYLELVPDEGGTWSISETRYWSLADTPNTPPADPVAILEGALRRAVGRQLVSDVPVGFYLSGGLDTSTVVAMASELSDDPIHTFCMGFSDASWDERPDARAVADHFGTNHHEIRIEGEFMADFPEMIWHADEPKRNLWPYYVAREMGEHVTVALGGLGADELFGGYVYRFDRLRDLDHLRSNLPTAVRESLGTAARTVSDFQVERGDIENDAVLSDVDPLWQLDEPATLYALTNSGDVIGDPRLLERRVFGDRLEAGVRPGRWIAARSPTNAGDLREQSLHWDFDVKLSDDFLLVEDRTSMAHSLESRVPFLDNDLIDLAFSIPVSEKFDDSSASSTGKVILRRAMRDTLPDAVFEKRKQGFTMPTLPFVRDELLDHAHSILDQPWIVRDGLVRGDYLAELLGRRPNQGLLPHYKLLWRLVALEIWYTMYVVEDVAGPRPIEHYYG